MRLAELFENITKQKKETAELNEEVFVIDKEYTGKFILVRHPCRAQLDTLVNLGNSYGEKIQPVRGLIDEDGALYIWCGYYMTHDGVINYLKEEHGVIDNFPVRLWLRENEIDTSPTKILSPEEKVKLFDNYDLKRLYGDDLDITFIEV